MWPHINRFILSPLFCSLYFSILLHITDHPYSLQHKSKDLLSISAISFCLLINTLISTPSVYEKLYTTCLRLVKRNVAPHRKVCSMKISEYIIYQEEIDMGGKKEEETSCMFTPHGIRCSLQSIHTSTCPHKYIHSRSSK